MTKNIVISGETLSGKTAVALALAAKLRSKGKTVSYWKPVGKKSFEHSKKAQDLDEDCIVMKEILALDADIDCICPIIRTQSSYDELLKIGYDALLQKLQKCYEIISKGYDYVLIEGAKAPWHLLHVNLSTPQIAKFFDAKVVCLVNFLDITAIDDVILQRDFFRQHGTESISTILNMVPPMLKSEINTNIKPFLEEQCIRFCGAIYHSREIFSPTVREVLKALDGELITGEDKLELLVDQFMIGAMSPENALKWFRRAKNKAVITSGDRSAICQAALETDTNLLILVGGMGPDIRTVSRAKEKGVPIIMTAGDTYSTGKLVDGLIGGITPENKERIKLVERVLGEAIDFSCLES